jgi:hypothetical protein
VTLLASELTNVDRITEGNLQPEVLKGLTYMLGFLVALPFTVSTLRSRREVDAVLGVLVFCTTVVAFLAIFEERTGINAFDHLRAVIPGIGSPEQPWLVGRGGRLRVLGSAQHPIALGALFAITLPFCLYLAERQRRRLWYACAALAGLATLSTVSRTAIVMLIVEMAVLFWLRPTLRRLWPLAIPVLLAAHFALPGTIGALTEAFLPAGGLVAEQQGGANTRGSGRLADLGPALTEVSKRPLTGDGFGTRVVEQDPKQNAPILDDAWLGLLEDVGIAGTIAFAWLLIRHTRRLVRATRSAKGHEASLLATFAATTIGFGVGMLTYDALSFVQITFVFFLLTGLGCVTLAAHAETAE